MTDLMTASGRTAALNQIVPTLRRLEDSLARQSRPVLKSIGNVETLTWAKVGGGVAAFAAIFYAAQALLRKPEVKAVEKSARGAVRKVKRTAANTGRRTVAAAKRRAKA